MGSSMKIVNASFFYDDKVATEEELLRQHYTTTGWGEALQRQGVEVIIIQRFSKESSFQQNGVHYYFIKDGLGGELKSWHTPLKCLRKIAEIDADVIHLHGFRLSLQTFFLRLMLRKKTAIIIQDHKSPGGIKRLFYSFLNLCADGFFFTSTEQGMEWLRRKKQFHKIMPVMEGATFFNFETRDADRQLRYCDRATARNKTGIAGSPVFIWVGRLDNNKDPLTVLDGFELLLQKHQNATLYMIYSADGLLNQVKSKIDHSSLLKSRVHLAGKIEHDELEAHYNSADYFLLGSHYEGSGYALSEAMSCGCIPVVTDIPSFRMMTNEGRLGALWQTENKESFPEAAMLAMNKPLEREANTCIEFFENKLSFDAIARIAKVHYQKAVESRSKM